MAQRSNELERGRQGNSDSSSSHCSHHRHVAGFADGVVHNSDGPAVEGHPPQLPPSAQSGRPSRSTRSAAWPIRHEC